MGEGDGTVNHSRLGWVSCIFFFFFYCFFRLNPLASFSQTSCMILGHWVIPIIPWCLSLYLTRPHLGFWWTDSTGLICLINIITWGAWVRWGNVFWTDGLAWLLATFFSNVCCGCFWLRFGVEDRSEISHRPALHANAPYTPLQQKWSKHCC